MQSIPAFYFDEQGLSAFAAQRAAEFREATPFPHITWDDFLPADVIQLLIDEFPDVGDIEWQWWGPGRSTPIAVRELNKLGQSNETTFGPFTRHFMNQLNSATFVSFVERLTGYTDLIVDPSFNGCGLHSTGRGGRLMIHTDSNRHPHSGNSLHQILNLIIYLNQDWRDDYGGHLELWTKDMQPAKRILPIANRAVLFFTGTRSLHGQPAPLNCPVGRRRNSLAVYYYTLHRPSDHDYDGMQRCVRWIPSSPEDLTVERRVAEEGRTKLSALVGRSISLSVAQLPFVVNPGWGDGAVASIFSWPSLPQRNGGASTT